MLDPQRKASHHIKIPVLRGHKRSDDVCFEPRVHFDRCRSFDGGTTTQRHCISGVTGFWGQDKRRQLKWRVRQGHMRRERLDYTVAHTRWMAMPADENPRRRTGTGLVPEVCPFDFPGKG